MALETHERTGRTDRRRSHRTCQHEWHLVSDDVDDFGPVRMFECHKCGRVHFT